LEPLDFRKSLKKLKDHRRQKGPETPKKEERGRAQREESQKTRTTAREPNMGKQSTWVTRENAQENLFTKDEKKPGIGA